jgi:hypothetical protein
MGADTVNLGSTLRGTAFAIGGLLVLAGVAFATSGRRTDDDVAGASPSASAVVTFGASVSADPTASAGADPSAGPETAAFGAASPSASADDDDRDDNSGPGHAAASDGSDDDGSGHGSDD